MKSGVLLLVLAMSLTPGIDGLSKQLTLSSTPFAVSFMRYLAAGLVALMCARMLGQPVRIPKRGRAGQIARTAILVGAMTCLIIALSMVPMALAAGGFLVAPLVAMTIGIIWFKEALTLPRIIGVIISLVGATLITRPAAGIETGTLFAFLGGALLGLYLAATRGAKDTGGPLASLAVQCLLGAALLLPLAIYSGLPAVTWGLVLSVIGLGVLSAMAHYLTVAAFERTDSAVLSPYLYFNLVAALIVGYLWFGEVPGTPALLGLALILIGGLTTLVPSEGLRRLVGRIGERMMTTIRLPADPKLMTERAFSAILKAQHRHGGDHERFIASDPTQAETS